MAKSSGLGDNFYIAAHNLSGDIGSLSGVSSSIAPLPVTGIDKSAHERIAGLRDGSMEFMTYFNPDAGAAHPVLSALPSGNVVMSYFRGTALGNPAASMVGKQINYDGSRGDDGSFTFSVSASANGYGLDWGRSLTAGVRTDDEATEGDEVDFGTGSTEFGLQVYVHLFAFTGTSVTIKVQESSDNGADTYADVVGATTGALVAPGAVRVATANDLTVERYLRVVTTGTFSNAEFAVVVVRNEAEVA